MKAIYINIDPYLAEYAAWLKAGKPGTVPFFQPLPLAVTVPPGESAGIYIVADAADAATACEAQTVTVDGQTLYVMTSGTDETGVPTAIAFKEVPGFSAVAPSIKYAVLPVTGGSIQTAITIVDAEDNLVEIPFTVLVRRETASGPVDLVDFTPPAAPPSAADIKSALIDAGSGALEGVSLAGTVLNGGESIISDIGDNMSPHRIEDGDTIVSILGYASQS